MVNANNSDSVEVPDIKADAEPDLLELPDFLDRRKELSVKAETKPIDAKDGLREIAERIRASVEQITKNIFEIGDDLISAKARLEHGKFGEWINREFGMTDRSARNYMRAAEWAKGKPEIVSVLRPITVYLLASPSTPKPYTDRVIADLEACKPINHDELEAQIRAENAQKKKATSDAGRSKKRKQAKLDAQEPDQLVAEIVTIFMKLSADDRSQLRKLVERAGPERLLDALSALDGPDTL